MSTEEKKPVFIPCSILPGNQAAGELDLMVMITTDQVKQLISSWPQWPATASKHGGRKDFIVSFPLYPGTTSRKPGEFLAPDGSKIGVSYEGNKSKLSPGAIEIRVSIHQTHFDQMKAGMKDSTYQPKETNDGGKAFFFMVRAYKYGPVMMLHPHDPNWQGSNNESQADNPFKPVSKDSTPADDLYKPTEYTSPAVAAPAEVDDLPF